MKRHIWYLLPLIILLPILAVSLFFFTMMMARPAQFPSLLKGTSLNISQAFGNGYDKPFDSRACLARSSFENCNGVLPFKPHFSVLSREEGSGYCFDNKRMAMEDQQITNESGKVIGDFQLWYLPSCQTYTSHLIFSADTLPIVSTGVQQFDGGGIWNGISKVMWHLGDQDPLLPSAKQTIGPLQDDEVWSPMLYSPTAPVQASATINSAGASYAPISSYYAQGKPTTINKKSV